MKIKKKQYNKILLHESIIYSSSQWILYSPLKIKSSLVIPVKFLKLDL